MKILLVGWGYPPNIEGGLDIHVANLFDCLKSEEDVDVSLAIPYINAPSSERSDIISIDVEGDDVFSISREISGKVPNIAEDFDIVHTHDWFGAETGLKCKKYCDTVWISTIHSLAFNRSRIVSKDISELEKVACTRCDYLITVSELLKEDVLKEHGVSSEVVYNGFSKPKSAGIDVKKDLGIEGDMVFFVGRHAEQKGIEHLIYGFKKYLDEGNDAVLVLGGDGYLKEAYKDFVDLLDIEEHVIFTGFLEDQILGDYYRCADVFVSPSFSEPFGLTITEALEMNTPVIATSSGVTEILPQNLVFDTDPDSESIKAALNDALSSKHDKKLEYNSRSWQDMTEEVLSIYRDAVN